MQLSEKQSVAVELVSMTGSVVAAGSPGLKAGGDAPIRVQLPENITPGVYILRVTGSGDFCETGRLVVTGRP